MRDLVAAHGAEHTHVFVARWQSHTADAVSHPCAAFGQPVAKAHEFQYREPSLNNLRMVRVIILRRRFEQELPLTTVQ